MFANSIDYYTLAFQPNLVLAGFKAAAKQAGIILQGDKVLAWQRISHKQAVGTLTSATFFGPAFTQPQDEHMMIVGLNMQSGINANLNATDWIPGPGAADQKQGDFDVLINNSLVLEDVPNNSIVRAEEEPYSGCLWFPRALFWVGQQELNMPINWGPIALAANTNIDFQLIGLKAI